MLERRWDALVDRARTLPPEQLHASVEGEWSFVQTLRHLAFATECWLLGRSRATRGPGSRCRCPGTRRRPPRACRTTARPGPTSTPRSRSVWTAAGRVRAHLARLTDEELAGMTTPVTEPGWPEPESSRCATACSPSSARSGSTGGSPSATSTRWRRVRTAASVPMSRTAPVAELYSRPASLARFDDVATMVGTEEPRGVGVLVPQPPAGRQDQPVAGRPRARRVRALALRARRGPGVLAYDGDEVVGWAAVAPALGDDVRAVDGRSPTSTTCRCGRCGASGCGRATAAGDLAAAAGGGGRLRRSSRARRRSRATRWTTGARRST